MALYKSVYYYYFYYYKQLIVFNNRQSLTRVDILARRAQPISAHHGGPSDRGALSLVCLKAQPAYLHTALHCAVRSHHRHSYLVMNWIERHLGTFKVSTQLFRAESYHSGSVYS